MPIKQLKKKGYKIVKYKGKVFAAPKSKSKNKKKVKNLGKIYAKCRSSKKYKKDTPKNKRICAGAAHKISGA